MRDVKRTVELGVILHFDTMQATLKGFIYGGGFMKKRTRIISAVSAMAVCASALAVFANAGSTYEKEYTVENILSDYQYL